MRAFISAIQSTFQNPNLDLAPSNFAGRVDRVIFMELYKSFPKILDSFEVLWNKFSQNYIANLKQESINAVDWEIFSGVREILEQEQKCSFLALLTGNIKQGAQIKLKHFKIWESFLGGGFGDVGTNRNHLAEIALKNCLELNNGAFKEVWVIGDTIADIECGKSIGAKTLGLRTGFSKTGDLEKAGADIVLDTLEGFSF